MSAEDQNPAGTAACVCPLNKYRDQKALEIRAQIMPSQSESVGARGRTVASKSKSRYPRIQRSDAEKEGTHTPSKQASKAHPYTRRDENALYQLDVDEGLFT
jgi:hypothetical protein